jgi:hypothetical protein
MSSDAVDTRLRHDDAHERLSGELYRLATLLKRTRDADAKGGSGPSPEVLLESIDQLLSSTMSAFMGVDKSALSIFGWKKCDNSTDSHEILAYVVEAEVGSQKLKCWLEFTEPRTQVSLDV